MARASLHKRYLKKVNEYNTLLFEGKPDSVKEGDKVARLGKMAVEMDKLWAEFMADTSFDGRNDG